MHQPSRHRVEPSVHRIGKPGFNAGVAEDGAVEIRLGTSVIARIEAMGIDHPGEHLGWIDIRVQALDDRVRVVTVDANKSDLHKLVEASQSGHAVRAVFDRPRPY